MSEKRALSPRPGAMPAGASAIYETLRKEIVGLQLLPGARLSENELALRFRTSRTPVREALFRLVDEGLIEVRPQRGSFVSRISLKGVKRARFIRSALELAIIREAASQGLPAAGLKEAERAIAEQQAAGGDAHRFKEADDRFHRAFADAIGYGDLWSVVESQKAQFDRIRLLSLPDVTPVDLLIRQHCAILNAVIARDADRAEAVLRAHLSIVDETATALRQTHPELVADDED
ncbi:GntR family transcriptional regulator [Aliidongia dinghuensis]|uniref:GntR family transcriptional regulator n=1 Tax=Aliidongia dinghuensis TaxID=1867774 RepID=A0A8J2YUZ9_9PROT|nr:GntR family transcriptional regulator [Aliidongia dinghuensis]GGF24981.1 GntR family transcriptional regulator [Aliidongia dinghuensis]